MENLKKILVEEINEVFNKIIKEENLKASEKIVDILVNEGFVQYKINNIYKEYGITQEVTIMRFNKYISKIYTDNSSRINELSQEESKTKIPDNSMSTWLSETIEDDLRSGIAPFANTKENIKKIHDIVINYDPLFDAINQELLNIYQYIEKQGLIEPVSFIEKSIEQPIQNDIDTSDTKEDIEEQVIPSVEEEEVEEYVSSPFSNII